MKLCIVAMASFPSSVLLSLCLFYLAHHIGAVGIKRRLQQHEESLAEHTDEGAAASSSQNQMLAPGEEFDRGWLLTLAQLRLKGAAA